MKLYAPCEHDFSGPHYVPDEQRACDGGTIASPVELLGAARPHADLEAAAKEWIGSDPPDDYPGNWDDMIQAVIEQTVKPVVLAALGADDEG